MMSRILHILMIPALLLSLFYVSGCSSVEKAKPPAKYPSEHPYFDPLTQIVIKADLIALGTITDNRTEVVTVWSEHPGKFAYTYFTLTVEKVLKGDPSIKEATIREDCGYLGDGVYQWSTACVGFHVSDHVLLGLIPIDDVYILYAAPYGDLGIPIDSVNSNFWWEGRSRDSLEEIIGRIIRIMWINNIPIALPHSEWPPLPAPEPVSPPKN